MNQARVAYDRWVAANHLGAAKICERLGGYRHCTEDTLYYEFDDGSMLILGSGKYNKSAVCVQEPVS